MLLITMAFVLVSFLFFFNDSATTEIYTLSLHDALPIYDRGRVLYRGFGKAASQPREVCFVARSELRLTKVVRARSEEHTSELQSQSNLVCRLLLEKKK